MHLGKMASWLKQLPHDYSYVSGLIPAAREASRREDGSQGAIQEGPVRYRKGLQRVTRFNLTDGVIWKTNIAQNTLHKKIQRI